MSSARRWLAKQGWSAKLRMQRVIGSTKCGSHSARPTVDVLIALPITARHGMNIL